MNQTVELPLWLFILIMLFAAVTAASHLLFPSVRWFFRRRLERAVKRLNTRLKRPIQPFKLARRHDMIQRLIYDPEVSKEIVNYARSEGVPENVAFEKARDFAREIVPSFSAFAYFSFGIRVARLLTKSVYRIETAPTNDSILNEIPENATIVFVMNHRSNMDYVLVTYLAARDSALSYAVGEWARVWPLSWLIKSLGAYFISRRPRGALYRKVMARYVQMATVGGVNQAFYPEGGLSLTGRLQVPKMGLMSYLVEGFDPEGERDVVFVPVAINYDRVLEDRVLIAAAQRGDRRFGARISVVVGFILHKLWQRLTFQDTRFGTAAVVFAPPLSLREVGQQAAVDGLAGELMARIARTMPVLAVPVVCHVLSGAGSGAGRISDAALRRGAVEILGSVSSSGRVVKPADVEPEIDRAIAGLVNREILIRQGNHWEIAPEEEAIVTFYANSIAHYFEDDAAVAKPVSATAGS